MQDAFGIVLVVVVVIAALIAVAAFVGTGRAYEQIGRGGLSIGDRVAPPMPGERDAELRQMLEARSARRVRRGGEPLDIDAELAALTQPAADPTLAAEIRGLVEARNARRVRQGKEPLDVDAEVARRMRDLADG